MSKPCPICGFQGGRIDVWSKPFEFLCWHCHDQYYTRILDIQYMSEVKAKTAILAERAKQDRQREADKKAYELSRTLNNIIQQLPDYEIQVIVKKKGS